MSLKIEPHSLVWGLICETVINHRMYILVDYPTPPGLSKYLGNLIPILLLNR